MNSQDEGGGFVNESGVILALPSVAEKGHMDVRVQVNTPGGHSSVPPAHTVIFILCTKNGYSLTTNTHPPPLPPSHLRLS